MKELAVKSLGWGADCRMFGAIVEWLEAPVLRTRSRNHSLWPIDTDETRLEASLNAVDQSPASRFKMATGLWPLPFRKRPFHQAQSTAARKRNVE